LELRIDFLIPDDLSYGFTEILTTYISDYCGLFWFDVKESRITNFRTHDSTSNDGFIYRTTSGNRYKLLQSSMSSYPNRFPSSTT